MRANLKPYSLGIVVENKPQTVDYILVSPLEIINIQKDGQIKEFKDEHTGDLQELTEPSFTTKHESRSYIKARWLPYAESNRTSAPDVAHGETVMIYKYEDIDEYFWFDVMREPELRRLEDVLYSYSNKAKFEDGKYDKESSYWIRYNTYDQYIHLHTSNNRGEPAIYDITIDTKEGVITIKDDLGNSIVFDSPNGDLTTTMNRDIIFNAGRDFIVNAGRNIVETADLVIHNANVRNTKLMSTEGSHCAHPNHNGVPGEGPHV